MKASRKKKPEVVVFEEPARKQRKKTLKRETRPNNEIDMGNISFKEIAQEVKELGLSGFEKKEQKKYKQQEAQALGAKAPKQQKMPYPLLMKCRKKKDERERKQQDLEAAMGIFKRKKKSDDRTKQILKGTGRWVDQSKGLDSGKLKKGVRKLKQKDIAKFKKSKT
ncbi:uncharacterized protein C1orf131-like [Dendronephthya gigantea]|uniref:uncharacterized protein C1orf131-like n=1 Tax=Dendronephthya gigantea TaxID=151771 RepID=UPI00106DB6C8|nr:uncharacterized protein C1orf131-like [Dendronephthya gigantea]